MLEQVFFPSLVFFIEALILVLAIGGLIVLATSLGRQSGRKGITITSLHKGFEETEDFLKSQLLEKSDYKKFKKAAAKKKKTGEGKRYFVLDFKGDTRAHQVENFREEVSAILTVATPSDEVIVKLKSPGGAVTGYGLAANQLQRLRDAGIHITACIDEVAASGGYMMACVAHRIRCARFGIVGSIGVVAPVPNFSRLLKKLDIDYNEYTSGDFKRTVSYLAPIEAKGEQKFRDQLEETHNLFKNMVLSFRPNLDMAKVSTGEYWHGITALNLGLVDEIGTSDDLILHASRGGSAYLIEHHGKRGLSERMGEYLQIRLRELFFGQNSL